MAVSPLIPLVGVAVAVAAVAHRVYENHRAKEANLVVEHAVAVANYQAPGGWQLTWTVRNRGPATAHTPTVWIVPKDTEPDGALWRSDPLAAGEPATGRLDVPADHARETLTVWIGWGDPRGVHREDSGKRVNRDTT